MGLSAVLAVKKAEEQQDSKVPANSAEKPKIKNVIIAEGDGFLMIKTKSDPPPSKANKIASERKRIKPFVAYYEKKREEEVMDRRLNAMRAEKLTALDTEDGNKYFYVNRRSGMVKPLQRANVPAIIYDHQIKFRHMTERQKRWHENVIDNEFLRQPTDKVTKSNNPLGRYRYVFWADLVANKNGMLYYLIPLITASIFLLLNVARYAFLENVTTALVTLLTFLAVKYTCKSPGIGRFGKTLSVCGICFLYLFAWYVLETRFNEIYVRIYLPYSLKLLLIVCNIYYFGKFYAIFAISYTQDVNCDVGNVVQVKTGAPRTGKTSQAVQEGYVMALMKWKQLQLDYWQWHSREAEILKRNNREELLEYAEIKASYNYYIMRPCIPCLWSNIAIQDKQGRRSSVATVDHIRGVERMPLYSVVVFDEIGAVLRAEDSNNKKTMYDVSDMFRLGGQFLKWAVIACEQDRSNIYIDCRRVVGKNVFILSQDWVCRPVLLYSVYKTLEFFVSDSLDKRSKSAPKFAHFMHRLKKFVYSIGFRKQLYTCFAGTESGAAVIEKSDGGQTSYAAKGYRARYVPSRIVADYDDRAYRENYPSYFDKKINGKLHDGLAINVSREQGRQYVSSTPLLEEKRDIQDVDIAKIE